MVAAGIWKRPEIDRIEASLYRKVLRVGNMISNKAILHTMTSIRLAGEVVNYLSKSAWEQFRRQNRVTAYFEMKETEGPRRTGSQAQKVQGLPMGGVEREPLPRREKFYVPKIMTNMMLATTGNGTSIHFGMNHLCLSHNKLYTLEHIGECDRLSGC
jgi:hypothetical protein